MNFIFVQKLLPFVAFSVLLLIPAFAQGAVETIVIEFDGKTQLTTPSYDEDGFNFSTDLFFASHGGFGDPPSLSLATGQITNNIITKINGDTFDGVSVEIAPLTSLIGDQSVEFICTQQGGGMVSQTFVIGTIFSYVVFPFNGFTNCESISWIQEMGTFMTYDNFIFQMETDDINIIGGEFLSIDSTALLLSGAQSFSWMIPVILSVLGIGLFVVSRKSE